MPTSAPVDQPSSLPKGDSKRPPANRLVTVAVGLFAAGALVAFGFSRTADNQGSPGPNNPPAGGVVMPPGQATTSVPAGEPAPAEENLVPTGTADIALPPIPPSTTTSP